MPKRKIKNQGSSTTQRRARPKCTTVDELGRMLMYAEGKDTPKDAIEAHKFKFEGWKSFAKAAIDELGLRDGADTQISKTYYNVWSRHADPQVVIDARAAAAATAATKPKQSYHAEHMARTRKKQRSLHEGGASAEAMRMTAGQSGNTLLASLGIEIAAAGMVAPAGQDEDEDGMRSTSKVTGQQLPSGWKAKDSSTTGEEYYVNLSTRASTYAMPTEPLLEKRLALVQYVRYST